MTEEKWYCPICRSETQTVGKPDDVGTQFYKCKNGHQTTKALDEKFKSIHEALEIQAEQNGDKTYVDPLNPMAAFCDGKGAFKPALVAEYLTVTYCFKTDRQTGILYFGDQKKGKWASNGEIFLQEILAGLLGIENRASHYNNILHDLKGLTYDDVVFSKKIAVENGLLDVETRELVPFTLDEMVFYSIPVTYNPQSKKCDNCLNS